MAVQCVHQHGASEASTLSGLECAEEQAIDYDKVRWPLVHSQEQVLAHATVGKHVELPHEALDARMRCHGRPGAGVGIGLEIEASCRDRLALARVAQKTHGMPPEF
ncbi:MAG TPA: hypothetical protein VGN32_01590 [Ktedonobacterales bacterium]|nr:hypothetical protein [Ktedonobacterales bacterium]